MRPELNRVRSFLPNGMNMSEEELEKAYDLLTEDILRRYNGPEHWDPEQLEGEECSPEVITFSEREKFLLGIIIAEWESTYLDYFSPDGADGDDFIFDYMEYKKDEHGIKFLDLSEGEVLERRTELYDALSKILSKLSRFCGEQSDLTKFGDFDE